MLFRSMSALAAAVPGATFSWTEASHALDCALDGTEEDVGSVNRKLLPALLAQTDVLAISSGQSLEEAYLKAEGTGSPAMPPARSPSSGA